MIEDMRNVSLLITGAVVAALAAIATAQNKADTTKPTPGVTTAMLENPSPDDWLMYSRTYDAQRFSPLEADQPPERQPASDRVDAGNGGRATTKAFRSCIAASCT